MTRVPLIKLAAPVSVLSRCWPAERYFLCCPPHRFCGVWI